MFNLVLRIPTPGIHASSESRGGSRASFAVLGAKLHRGAEPIIALSQDTKNKTVPGRVHYVFLNSQDCNREQH